MAFTILGKIEELEGKVRKDGSRVSDGSIRKKYDTINDAYKKAEAIYKNHKVNYEDLHEDLYYAQQKYESIPKGSIAKRQAVRREVNGVKKAIKESEALMEKAKLNYKDKLKRLREIRSEIREQYKHYKAHEKMVRLCHQAVKEGVVIPEYLKKEAKKHNRAFKTSCYKDVNRCYKTTSIMSGFDY